MQNFLIFKNNLIKFTPCYDIVIFLTVPSRLKSLKSSEKVNNDLVSFIKGVNNRGPRFYPCSIPEFA